MRADFAKGDAVTPMFQSDTSKLLPKIVAIVITLSAAAALCWQARQLYLQMSRPQVTASAAPASVPQLSPQLLQRLFGNPAATGAANLPGVQLQGCIVAADPSQSQALINIEGQGAFNALVGDEFLPGVVLQLIAHDHVLFTRNGVEGRLDFPSAAATQPAGGAK